MVTKVAKEYPEAEVRGRRRLRADRATNVTNLAFSPRTGLLPRRCRRRPEDQDQPGRLRGRRHKTRSSTVRGRLQAGVKAVNPKIKVDDQVAHPDQADLTGFANPPGGKTAATALYDNGADIVFHASGAVRHRCLRGRGRGRRASWAIGVDSDQYLTAPEDAAAAHPDLGAQARRRRGVRLHQGLQRRQAAKPGFDVYDLKSDGVGYSTTGGFSRRHQGQDRRLQGRRSSTARSRCPTSL